MKLNLTLKDLAGAAGAELVKGDGGEKINSFVTDTRIAKKGGFIWALKGKKRDAHDFLGADMAGSSMGWLVEKSRLSSLEVTPQNLIAASDTLKALHRLANWHRKRLGSEIIAVVGSNGKTTTKDIIGAILKRRGPAFANRGSLNNEFGLPLSILEMEEKHGRAVLEMGASRKGDIQTLGRVAEPDYAVITNISAAHLEFFKSLERTFQTKTEIIDCLKEGGTFAYNAGDEYLSVLRRRSEKKISFAAGKADVVLAGRKPLLLRFPGGKEIRADGFRLEGAHNALNACAAAAVAFAAGFSPEEIKSGIEAAEPAEGRMQKMTAGKMTVIFDAYNANPESMNAALDWLEENGKRPFCLVLGDMKELGAYSYMYHRNLGERILRLAPERVFMAGEEMRPACEVLLNGKFKGTLVYEKEPEWTVEVKKILSSGESGTMLIKASRAMNFEKILEEITSLNPARRG